MNTGPWTLVIAEDDEGHAVLIQRNLRRAGFANDLIHVKDGQEALDCLRGEGQFQGNTFHGFVLLLLDVHMPRVDGFEVLQRLKADPVTARVPVIMLTTTDNPHEVERCYQLGCSAYLTKPVEHDGFIEAINRLGLFLQVVKVPRNGGNY